MAERFPQAQRWRSAALLALCVACTSTGTKGDLAPARPVSVPPPSPNPARTFVSGPCPVTRPVPREQIPRPVVDAVLGDYVGPSVRNIGAWYGNDALWVELPAGSQVMKRAGEELSEKFPWVRLVRGYVDIHGSRIDGPAPPAKGDASTGNGRIGFQSSGIWFPTTGCWRIMGTIGTSQLSFTIEVVRAVPNRSSGSHLET